MSRHRPRRLPLRWLVITALAAGCGGTPQGPADFEAPALESGKSALTTSLEAWKSGRRDSGVLIGSKPAIGVVDAARADRPLLDYEIVGPLMVDGKVRPFAVRLILGEPREAIATRYMVMGRDPLWVFRQEDFERMLHWEHKMDDPAAAPASGPPAEVR